MKRSIALIGAVAALICGCNGPKSDDSGQAEAQRIQASKQAEADRQRDEQLLVANELAKHQAQVDADNEAAASQAAEEQKEQERAWLASVREMLKDPDSAQFKNVRFNFARDTLCGEVNSRNAMGGYVGFKDFFVINGNPIIDSSTPADHLEFISIRSKADCG